jgi:hypothetical protein
VFPIRILNLAGRRPDKPRQYHQKHTDEDKNPYSETR